MIIVWTCHSQGYGLDHLDGGSEVIVEGQWNRTVILGFGATGSAIIMAEVISDLLSSEVLGLVVDTCDILIDSAGVDKGFPALRHLLQQFGGPKVRLSHFRWWCQTSLSIRRICVIEFTIIKSFACCFFTRKIVQIKID